MHPKGPTVGGIDLTDNAARHTGLVPLLLPLITSTERLTLLRACSRLLPQEPPARISTWHTACPNTGDISITR